jgi:hypothetical protein
VSFGTIAMGAAITACAREKMGPMWARSPHRSAVEAIRTLRDFQSSLDLMDPCRITRHCLDQSSTDAGLLVDLVHVVCFVHLVGLVSPNKRDKLNNSLLPLI